MAFANYSAKAIMVFTLGFLRELFLILCYCYKIPLRILEEIVSSPNKEKNLTPLPKIVHVVLSANCWVRSMTAASARSGKFFFRKSSKIQKW